MSAELTPGEGGTVPPPTSTTHIRDNSVMSNNINILNRVNHLGNDQMEAPGSEDPLLISVVASSQSLATKPQSAVSQARREADCPAPGTLYTSVISTSYSGPPPSEVVDASARTAFSGKLGHKNAISDECSSNGGSGDGLAHQSDGAVVPGLKMGSPLASTQGDSFPTRVVCETKTVNQHYDIPTPDQTQDHDTDTAAAQSVTPSFNKEGDTFSSSPSALANTYPAAAGDSKTGAALRSLSSTAVLPSRRGGWMLPPGGGLRGGAPLPGETSAISNGTSGWGPPPSNSAGGGGTSGWGAATPATPSSAWGTSQPNNNGDTETANNSKMLNTIPPSSQPSQMTAGLQAPAPALAPAPGTQGSTSWAAAAGKGLPPSEGPSQQNSNGGTNKQLEQLNSVREALFSQDGWGCQHVKQDTSWDMGGAGAGGPPASASAAAAAPSQPSEQAPVPPAGAAPKPDNMQWTPPGSSGRNDGTDLWRTTLSGVPQPTKPAPTTPWGNHTPAHPADYKTWGEPDQEISSEPLAPSQPADMWNPGGGAAALAEPGPAGPRGGHGGWEQERPSGDRAAQFDERPNWGGAPKPKDEPLGWNGGSNQWGPGGGAGGGVGVGGGSGPGGNPGAGWGAPPAKTSQPGGGGWGNAPGAQQAPPRAPQWENESPPMGRRFDDGGTGLWGKPQPGMQGPPGGWKDMPVPNIGARGPPGSTSRLPPGGPGVKPVENSPWGGAHPGRGWEEGGMASSAGSWGPMEDKPPRTGSSGDMWSDNKNNWNGNRLPTMPGMRSSPSWDESPAGMGMGGRNWGGAGERPGAVTKDFIWSSKQFRILCEMGYVKEDVETALRNTNMQLEDALEMLNALNRGGMPAGRVGGGGGNGGGGGGGLPPNDVFPPRRDEYNGLRFPGPMPYPPGSGDLPGAVNRPGSINPSLSGGPNLPGGPPRPQPNGPPSTSQLRVLVQQIQMAVQAGHLNPQILNQPLAPQTLYLLNQLLHRIKELQSCQQQHAIAQAQAGQRPGANQQQALLGLTVQITKHKQQITNLQNQITAQQAQYLKSQQPQPIPGGGGQNPDELAMGISNMNIENGSTPSSGGSKLLQMINKDNDNFARAPGSAKTSTSSPNLLLDNGPWSNGQGNSGWPDSSGDKPVNTSNSTDDDNFGIPEFVPGKAWKGAAQMKDPTEDPTMTPGSVASSAIIAPLTTTEKTTSSAAEPSHSLSSSTWSLSTPTTKEAVGSKDSWGLPTSSSSNTLTEMGQNLWGQSRSQSSKQQTPTTSITGWPTSNGLSSSGGWSNGSTTTTSSYLGSVGSSASGSAWLLLKNLTAQIDGSTLRTLCMQHGPLHNFHLYLTHGIALVKYSNGQEAKKAQNALNNCVLGNTTILAATAEEPEVESIIRTLSQHSAGAPGGYSSSISKSNSSGERDTWSSMGSSGIGSSGMGSAGIGSSGMGSTLGWPASSLGGSVWGAPDSDQHNRTTPLNSFLPPDLLSEGM